jgi:hypothetical protein
VLIQICNVAFQVQVVGSGVASPHGGDAAAASAAAVGVLAVREDAVGVRGHLDHGGTGPRAAGGGAAGQAGDVAAVPGARAGQQVQPHVPAPPGQQAPPAAAHAHRALLADARAHHQQDRLQRQGAHPDHHRTLRRQIRPAQRGLQRGLP